MTQSRQQHGAAPHHKPKDAERDPIADYKEWTEHRYDPGYFTGGRLPPGVRWLQKSSTAYKRFLLIVLLLALAAMVFGVVWPLFR